MIGNTRGLWPFFNTHLLSAQDWCILRSGSGEAVLTLLTDAQEITAISNFKRQKNVFAKF